MSGQVDSSLVGAKSAEARPLQPSWLAHETGLLYTLWRRDLLRLRRQPARWLGVVLQPVLLWVLLGSGLADRFVLTGSREIGYLTYFFPGVVVMILLFTTIFASISVIEDRRMGFLQGVLVAPGSRFSLILGKIAGVTTLAVIQAALFLLVTPLAGYSLGQVGWLQLVAVVLLACVGLAALNLAVAWIIDSVQGYHAVMSVALIPLWIVSGAMFPTEGTWLASLAIVNPMTYMVEGVRQALGGGLGGAGLGVCVAIELAFAAAAVGWAVWVSRRP